MGEEGGRAEVRCPEIVVLVTLFGIIMYVCTFVRMVFFPFLFLLSLL